MDTLNTMARHPNSSVSERMRTLRAVAKRRGLDQQLSLADYKKLVIGARCYYCFDDLPLTGYGLDRLDASVGYVLGNVVPCCTGCNTEKRTTHHDAFMAGLVREAFYACDNPGGEL